MIPSAETISALSAPISALLSFFVLGLSYQTHRAQKRASARESIEQLEHTLVHERRKRKLVPVLDSFRYLWPFAGESAVSLIPYLELNTATGAWAGQATDLAGFDTEFDEIEMRLSEIDDIESATISDDESMITLTISSANPIKIRNATLAALKRTQEL